MANDAENAICALREATAALRRATDRRAVRDSGIDKSELIAGLAANLEALAALVRTTGPEATPTSSASHNLLAVMQGVTGTAAMARRGATSGGDRRASHLVRNGRLSTTPDD